MEIIIHDTIEGKQFEFLIGYIRKFVHKDPLTKKVFGVHPKEKAVYQLLKDDNGYVIHTGKVNQKSTLQGIFIGPELQDDQDSKWEYDIVVLDKSNMLDFDLNEEDLKRIEDWIDTDHNDLRTALGEGSSASLPEIELKPLNIQDLMPAFVQNALITEDKKQITQTSISDSLTHLSKHDPEMLESIKFLLEYLVHKNSSITLRAYILQAETPTAANSVVISQLESYEESGDLLDLLKAMETCLFEVQKYS